MVFRPGDVANPTGIGGWKPGQSGNLVGRPRGAQQIQNRALAMCDRALELLGEIMDGKVDKSIGHLQMSAAMAVLDRGCGKAGQSLAIAIDLKKRLTESHEELLQLREQYMAAVGPEPMRLIEHNENEMDGAR
jgi:hypothetical protein